MFLVTDPPDGFCHYSVSSKIFVKIMDNSAKISKNIDYPFAFPISFLTFSFSFSCFAIPVRSAGASPPYSCRSRSNLTTPSWPSKAAYESGVQFIKSFEFTPTLSICKSSFTLFSSPCSAAVESYVWPLQSFKFTWELHLRSGCLGTSICPASTRI